jgi:eukaryotic-like serine/threonine-protein kinase
VISLAWSPDSQRIASASFDDTVRVWDAADGSEIYLYAGHSKSVWSVCWSPDGMELASSSEDQTAQIWSVG